MYTPISWIAGRSPLGNSLMKMLTLRGSWEHRDALKVHLADSGFLTY